MEPSTYIFDLYGTLIDIRTDEESPAFWRRMAELYGVYGADYRPAALREAYRRLCAEEETALAAATGVQCPEIRLERVFERLLREAPARHPAALRPDEAGLAAWSVQIAAAFRVLSRRRFRLYPHTLQVLDELRRRGARLMLLSNAQAVFTRPELEVLDLPRRFEAVYLSSDHGVKKPEAAFLERLLREQGLRPEEALMVGNEFASDMAVAAACGVPGAFLNTGGLSAAEMEARRAALAPAAIRLLPGGDLRELLD